MVVVNFAAPAQDFGNADVGEKPYLGTMVGIEVCALIAHLRSEKLR